MSAAVSRACHPRGVDRTQKSGRTALKFRHAIRHQRARVRKVLRQKRLDGACRVEAREAQRTARRQEQGRGKAAVLVRQGDEHVAAARPDVQRLALHAIRIAGACRDRELLVAVLEVVFARLDDPERRHAPARHRPGAVGGEQGPHGNLDDGAAAKIPEAGEARGEVGLLQAVLESRLDARAAQRHLEKHPIEPRPRDGVDDFVGALTVGLKRSRSVRLMDEASAHGNQSAFDLIEHAGERERMNAPVGQRQVDGAAGSVRASARIGPAVVERHACAAPLEQDREQRTGGSGAGEGDRFAREIHAAAARARTSTARATSPNEL